MTCTAVSNEAYLKKWLRLWARVVMKPNEAVEKLVEGARLWIGQGRQTISKESIA